MHPPLTTSKRITSTAFFAALLFLLLHERIIRNINHFTETLMNSREYIYHGRQQKNIRDVKVEAACKRGLWHKIEYSKGVVLSSSTLGCWIWRKFVQTWTASGVGKYRKRDLVWFWAKCWNSDEVEHMVGKVSFVKIRVYTTQDRNEAWLGCVKTVLFH